MFTIIILAYNRPKSLMRLFRSLTAAHINVPINLIISLDGGASEAVLACAKDFSWPHGAKQILDHQSNMGLRAHVLHCGRLSLTIGSILMLEDDITVSPNFVDYATASMSILGEEERVCGISLYAPVFNETTRRRFDAIYSGHDNYFMQLPCSWGQIWTPRQWSEFEMWLAEEGQRPIDIEMPSNILKWSERSWKKLFAKYMIAENKYFSYPYFGYSTNNADAGENVDASGNFLQSRLMAFPKLLSIVPISSETVYYDAWGEIIPTNIAALAAFVGDGLVVDIHQSKSRNFYTAPYILTVAVPGLKAERTFGLDYVPAEMNIFLDVEGPGLAVYSRNTLSRHINGKPRLRSLVAGLYPMKNVVDAWTLLQITAARRGREVLSRVRRVLR